MRRNDLKISRKMYKKISVFHFMRIPGRNQISSLTLVTPCTHKDCQNDSECLIKNNIGVCRCQPGFYGQLCELTPCSENLCENGAHCQIEGNSYLCNCPAGFSGLYCEKTPCSDNPCENAGECLVDGDSYKCNCPGLDFLSEILSHYMKFQTF